jgi:hypothetical protein
MASASVVEVARITAEHMEREAGMRLSRSVSAYRSGTIICLSALLLPAAAPADDCGTVRIVPPHAVVEGKTLGEWHAIWWQWAVSMPRAINPVNEGPCNEGQDYPVFFLAGNTGGESPPRHCTVPCGKPIFLPILNAVFAGPGECPDCKSCMNLAEEFVDNPSLLELVIDGEALPGERLLEHREPSPACFDLDAVDDNLFGAPPGLYTPAACDGFVFLLEPLCPGEEHTLSFSAVAGPPDCTVLCVEVSYTLRAAPYFRRGDTDGDGRVQITDPIHTLNALFTGGEAIACEDAADANDDGTVNIADPVFTLNWLFLGGPPPPSPGPLRCGPDPTEDALECTEKSSC